MTDNTRPDPISEPQGLRARLHATGTASGRFRDLPQAVPEPGA